MAQTSKSAHGTTARGTILTYFVGVLALLCIVAAAADFFLVAQSATYDNEFLSNASVAAVQSQALANNAGDALAGDSDAFGALNRGADRMQAAIAVMGGGDAATLLPAASGQVAANVALLQQHWSDVNDSVQT
ncbi:MAG: type IV pili methyl-accepting chemotaxis transducer N-terminal domain-containing protein, partial [Gammaproteobacteria bacterium]